MDSEMPLSDDGPPTDEIYLELRELTSAVKDASTNSSPTEPAPAVADDDPTGIKARIARLRAVLTDRGVEPPT
jgi:hypothetical protein